MRVTAKGQVTIPQAIREQAGLLPNTEVEFLVEEGSLRKAAGARPARRDMIESLDSSDTY